MLGIGIDIVDIRRMRNIINVDDKAFINRVFTEREILCSRNSKDRAEYFSFLFTFKESFVKARGSGFTSFAKPKHIEVRFVHNSPGCEKAALEGINAHFKKKKINLISLKYFRVGHNLVCGLIADF